MRILLTNPLLLAAGAAAAFAPLVLHLWMRSRYRSIDWGAMMFFPVMVTSDGEGARLRQWTLLALRMLTIVLLGAALARPILTLRADRAGALPAAPQPSALAGGQPPGGISADATTVVLLIDRSISMSLDEQGRSRMSLAQDAADQVLQVLADRHRGDRAALIPMGIPQGQTAAPLPTPTSDLADVRRRAAELTPVPAAADIASGLLRGLDVLSQADTPTRLIYVICDRQAVSWNSVDDTFIAEWRRRVAEMSAHGQSLGLFVVPVGAENAGGGSGGGAPGNVFIASMQLDGPPPVVEAPTATSVLVRNSGALGRTGVPLTLTVAEESGHRYNAAQTTLRLSGDASEPIRCPLMFDESGSRLLEADVRAAGMWFDKRYAMAINVSPPTRVLLVAGGGTAITSRDSQVSYVRLALMPFHTHQNPAMVDAIAADQWNPTDLEQKYQVIALDGVDRISPRQADALTQFVYDGGGLVVAPGNDSSLDNLNQQLYRNGAGILPAELKNPSGGAASATRSAATSTAAGQNSVTWVDLASPVFQFLAGRADALPPASVWRYLVAAPRAAAAPQAIALPPARVLGKYASGAPFLIEGRAGRGRVLLLTTTLDPSWNDLPLTNFFLPFMQSVVQEAAAGQATQCNVDPGQPLVCRLAQGVEPASVQLQLPSNQIADASSIALAPIGDSLEFRFTRTKSPGVYRLHYTTRQQAPSPQTIGENAASPSTPPATVPSSTARTIETRRTEFFVVRPSRADSDVSPLSQTRWQQLESMLNFQRIEPDQRSMKASLTALSRQGHYDLWLWLLLAMLIVSALELFLSRAWSTEADPATA